MIETLDVLNLKALTDTALKSTPFPYLVVDNIINETVRQRLIADLPKISMEGSIPLAKVDIHGVFQQLLEEMKSESFKQAIATKLGMDLNGRPTMVTYRSRARKKDGRIHTDTKSKLVTVLLYLNEDWQHEAGRLRVLNNGKNLEDYVTEITPLLGRCLIFKVTDNCWHGHKPLIASRRSIQLNYVVDESALNKHSKKHGFSARIKALTSSFVNA